MNAVLRGCGGGRRRKRILGKECGILKGCEEKGEKGWTSFLIQKFCESIFW